MKEQKFPKSIFVTQYKDRDGDMVLEVANDFSYTDEGASVGIYELKDIKQHKAVHRLE